MISIHLRDFFVPGLFRPIQLGMTKTNLEALLGCPDNWGGSLPGLPSPDYAVSAQQEKPYYAYPIWMYDAIEFHFGAQDELFLIHCDHFDDLTVTEHHLQIDRWVCVDPPLRKVEVQIALEQQQVAYDYHPKVYGGVFRSPKSVELAYDAETDSLAAISLCDYRYLR